MALILRDNRDGEEIALPVALRSLDLQLTMLDTGGPGQLLHQAYSFAGRYLEKALGQAAHKLGLGPGPTSRDIENAFGEWATRQSMLDTIYVSFQNNTTTHHELALKKDCKNLLKYALPSESPTTRIQAFRCIIVLTTRYPGLRRIFLQSPAINKLENSPNAICCLWKSAEYKPDTEARFTLEFAAHCLAKCDLNTYLGGIRPTELGRASEEGMGVIDTLLVRYCNGVSGFPRLIAVRYLAGILELPSFWLENYHFQKDTMDKLCKHTLRLIEDIDPDSVTVNDFGKLALLDPDGVDALAEAILVGGEKWIQRYPQIEDYWLNNFIKLIKMLRGLTIPNFLPNAYRRAEGNWEACLKGTVDQMQTSNLDYHYEDLYEFVNGPVDLQSAMPFGSNWSPSDIAEEFPKVTTLTSSPPLTTFTATGETIPDRNIEEEMKPTNSLTGEDLPQENHLRPETREAVGGTLTQEARPLEILDDTSSTNSYAPNFGVPLERLTSGLTPNIPEEFLIGRPLSPSEPKHLELEDPLPSAGTSTSKNVLPTISIQRDAGATGSGGTIKSISSDASPSLTAGHDAWGQYANIIDKFPVVFTKSSNLWRLGSKDKALWARGGSNSRCWLE